LGYGITSNYVIHIDQEVLWKNAQFGREARNMQNFGAGTCRNNQFSRKRNWKATVLLIDSHI